MKIRLSLRTSHMVETRELVLAKSDTNGVASQRLYIFYCHVFQGRHFCIIIIEI